MYPFFAAPNCQSCPQLVRFRTEKVEVFFCFCPNFAHMFREVVGCSRKFGGVLGCQIPGVIRNKVLIIKFF